MGSCRNCGNKTKYPHNNGWCPLCFHLNYKEPRMYFSFIITLISLQLPVIDGNGLRAWLMKSLYEITGWKPFLLASIFISILIIIATYMGVSYFLYELFKKLR